MKTLSLLCWCNFRTTLSHKDTGQYMSQLTAITLSKCKKLTIHHESGNYSDNKVICGILCVRQTVRQNTVLELNTALQWLSCHLSHVLRQTSAAVYPGMRVTHNTQSEQLNNDIQSPQTSVHVRKLISLTNNSFNSLLGRCLLAGSIGFRLKYNNYTFTAQAKRRCEWTHLLTLHRKPNIILTTNINKLIDLVHFICLITA